MVYEVCESDFISQKAREALMLLKVTEKGVMLEYLIHLHCKSKKKSFLKEAMSEAGFLLLSEIVLNCVTILC